jgi:hypothetical protein
VPASLSDDDVRGALREMLASGSTPRPRVTAAEVRMRAERRLLPRVDSKVLVTLAAAVVLLVVLFASGPFRHNRMPTTSASPAMPASIAHSAYGLQITVPTRWSVQVFGQCPGRKPGTLFIGTAEFVVNCPAFDSSTNIVSMSDANSVGSTAIVQGQQYRTIRVNGLTVLASATATHGLVTAGHWYVPSKHVSITGTGPSALAVMRTLTRATAQASPATGFVSGTEQLSAVVVVPASGPISVVRPPSKTIHTVTVLNGQFSFTGAPGRYVLTGHDGNAPCPPVAVTVISAERVASPPIVCQGM